MWRVTWALLFLLLYGCFCTAQTTQGIITGRIRDQLTGAPLGGATVEYEQAEKNIRGRTVSAGDGSYYVPLLPPGNYHVRITRNDYQARELYGVIVSVAGYAALNFDMRPLSDTWNAQAQYGAVFQHNTILPFYGPDVDPSFVGSFEPEKELEGQLEPSISEVIDPRTIDTLPLTGRDVYTALVLQPGVTADTSTNRSLGLSANGQRPSSSTFLLDGIETNDQLLSGPSVELAPEMVQEYRVSTNNFSAEYGRTAGYIANAITRSAATRWHGIGYGDLNNDALNANTFQHNVSGLPRSTLHQIESGFSVGGAIPRTKVFTWTALDYFGSKSYSDPQQFTLPTLNFFNSLPSNSRARQLLQDDPPAQWANNADGVAGAVTLLEPVTLHRFTGLERVDYALSARQHLMGHIAGSSEDRPDFYWSPYAQSPLDRTLVGVAAGLTSEWSPTLTSEIRGGYQVTDRAWGLALQDLPQARTPAAQLPGYCCGALGLAWSDREHSPEFSGDLVIAKGPHLVKIGAGVLGVHLYSGFQIPAGQFFTFLSLQDFANDQPYDFSTILSRTALAQNQYVKPDSSRAYSYFQPDVFLQEDFRVSSRLTVNAGVRYDRFSAPTNIGSVPDEVVALGSGSSFDYEVAGATLQTQRGSLFSAHPNNVAVRLGFSWLIWPGKGTVLRGGAGTFFDRLFDNYWVTSSTNDMGLYTFILQPNGRLCNLKPFYVAGDYSSGPANCSAGKPNSFLDMTLFHSGLKSPRVGSVFLSLQQPLGRNLALELDGAGSRGRNLLATDVINRQVGAFAPANGLPPIDYRTNEGFSDYSALSVTAKYRTGPATFNTSWTWSHSIDNESDPLLGEYFDLGFSNQSDRVNPGYYGAFTFPGDTRADRGNSDFDQRQNFVGWVVLQPPGPHNRSLQSLLRNWTLSGVFALRSGLPYSVYAGEVSCDYLCNTRAAYLGTVSPFMNVPADGGRVLLNSAAFTAPAGNEDGNTGRNAFTGPGFANLDISIARSFALRRLETARLTLRADIFNAFNHANLQQPDAYWGTNSEFPNSDFGVAPFARTASQTGFPALTPLIDNPRLIHVMLRFEF